MVAALKPFVSQTIYSKSPRVQGYNATLANVELVVAAFRDGLQQQGYSKAA